MMITITVKLIYHPCHFANLFLTEAALSLYICFNKLFGNTLVKTFFVHYVSYKYKYYARYYVKGLQSSFNCCIDGQNQQICSKLCQIDDHGKSMNCCLFETYLGISKLLKH